MEKETKTLGELKEELNGLYSTLKMAPSGEEDVTLDKAHKVYPSENISENGVYMGDPISGFVRDLGFKVTEKGKTR